jgi:AcrR family transcriptional regulator
VQRAADVSASQIYYYFADKKALVRAVIAYQTGAVLGVHMPLLSRLDSMEALEAWRGLVVSLCWERRNQQSCPIGSLSSELASNDPDTRADLVISFNRWECAIRDGLAAMRTRGELRADADPERLALALLAALQGGLLLTQARRDTTALEIGLDTMIDSIRCSSRPPGRAARAEQ